MTANEEATLGSLESQLGLLTQLLRQQVQAVGVAKGKDPVVDMTTKSLEDILTQQQEQFAKSLHQVLGMIEKSQTQFEMRTRSMSDRHANLRREIARLRGEPVPETPSPAVVAAPEPGPRADPRRASAASTACTEAAEKDKDFCRDW